MAASVSFNCNYCANVKTCEIKPENNYKELKGKDKWCFVSQKAVDNLQTYTFRGRKVKQKKAVQEEETENANG
jgi:hypothetical protein